MKRFAAMLVIFFSFIAAVSGQEKSITILDFVNATGDETNSTLARTMQGIIESGIRYIGDYRIMPTPTRTVGTDEKNLKEYAELAGCEYILFGSLSPAKSGAIALEGNLYNRTADAVFPAREEIAGVLDVFSASDSLSLKILSELHKTKIAYGTLSVKTNAGAFDVYVNGVLAGSNQTSFPNIPDGYKNVRVVSRSGTSDGKTVFAERVLVKADGTTTVAVSVPDKKPRVAGRTDAGLLTITSEPAGMQLNVDGKETAPTPLTLEVAPGNHTFKLITTVINGYYHEGQVLQEVNVPAGAETFVPNKLKTMDTKIYAGMIPDGYQIFLDGKEAVSDHFGMIDCKAKWSDIAVMKDGKTVVSEKPLVTPYENYLLRLGRTKDSAYPIEEHEIAFKKKTDSWDTVAPVFFTFSPQSFSGSVNYGITSVKFARDKQYFYWHVDFNKTNPLYWMPRKDCKEVVLQVCLYNLQDGKGFNFNLVNGPKDWSSVNIWNNTTDTSTTVAQPSRVTTNTSVTGRISLSTLRDHLDSAYEVDVALAKNNWSESTTSKIGWVDFGFLAKE